jgi:mono/diheme cytochrome c family protein
VKRFCITNDQICRAGRRISVPLGGPGPDKAGIFDFCPAEAKDFLRRLQPLKLRLIATLPRVLPLLLVVAALILASPAARAQQPGAETAPAGNAQTGKKIFMNDGCYECHGREGQGATQTGATRIGPPQLSLEAFLRYVRQPTNQMPPYTNKAVSDQDLTDIYAFLKTIPQPPKGKDIPLLNK